eukprot:6181171-Pleurochrysis_carterae.AAC.2
MLCCAVAGVRMVLKRRRRVQEERRSGPAAAAATTKTATATDAGSLSLVIGKRSGRAERQPPGWAYQHLRASRRPIIALAVHAVNGRSRSIPKLFFRGCAGKSRLPDDAHRMGVATARAGLASFPLPCAVPSGQGTVFRRFDRPPQLFGRAQMRSRIFAVSDVHADHALNFEWCRSLCEGRQYADDAILVAGDLASGMKKLREALMVFKQARPLGTHTPCMQCMHVLKECDPCAG